MTSDSDSVADNRLVYLGTDAFFTKGRIYRKGNMCVKDDIPLYRRKEST